MPPRGGGGVMMGVGRPQLSRPLTPLPPPTHHHTPQNTTKQDLKDEYRLYRKQALAALREKDAAIAALSNGGTAPPATPASASASASASMAAGGGGNGGGGGGLNLRDPSVVYLRNLCEKFFSTESPEVGGGIGGVSGWVCGVEIGWMGCVCVSSVYMGSWT